jgi:hypothetical protein
MVIWPVLIELLRYRFWKKTWHTGSSPGTQDLVVIGTVGIAFCIVGLALIEFF